MRPIVSLAVAFLLCLGVCLAQEEPFRMGCVTFAKDATATGYRQLAAYLGQEIERDILLTLYPSYPEVIHDLANDNIQIAVLSPIVYLTTGEVCELTTLANAVYRSTGDFMYRSVILVPEGSSAHSLADLAGHRMAFVDLLSASGYVVPLAALTKVGVTGEKAVKGSFFGNHVDGVQALLDDEVDAAATYDLVFNASKEVGDTREKLRVLWTSEFAIPSDTFVTTKKVPGALNERLVAALLAYQSDDNPLYKGFVQENPEHFKGLIDFLAKFTGSERASR